MFDEINKIVDTELNILGKLNKVIWAILEKQKVYMQVLKKVQAIACFLHQGC